MSGVATSPSFRKVVTATGSLLWSVAARRLRRRLLTAKAPAFVRSVAAFATATAAFVLAALSACAVASVPVIGAGELTVAEKVVVAAGVATSSLVAALSELSPAAARVAVG